MKTPNNSQAGCLVTCSCVERVEYQRRQGFLKALWMIICVVNLSSSSFNTNDTHQHVHHICILHFTPCIGEDGLKCQRKHSQNFLKPQTWYFLSPATSSVIVIMNKTIIIDHHQQKSHHHHQPSSSSPSRVQWMLQTPRCFMSLFSPRHPCSIPSRGLLFKLLNHHHHHSHHKFLIIQIVKS